MEHQRRQPLSLEPVLWPSQLLQRLLLQVGG
jgi:hypothetical protein